MAKSRKKDPGKATERPRGEARPEAGERPAPAGPLGASGPGMDEISAHLDRGWDLVQRGDPERARVSAQRVLELDENSPEGYTLLGAIAAAAGEADEALGHYRRAMELDPGFVDPLLYAAEVYLWPLCEPEQAARLCEQALDVAEEEDEYLDALLLKAEAEVAMGDDDSAQATLAELPEIDLPEPVYHLRAARTFLDLGLVAEAEAHYLKALERDPQLSDAIHGLGLCAEERDDRETMIRHFLRVRKLDLEEPKAPWGVSAERFEEIGTRSLAELPERIRKLLENVPVVAEDYPAEELVREGYDPRVLGFFSGVPYPEKSTLGTAPHLDCIFLYQRNIEKLARNVEEVEEEIKKTLVHEAGHFFGLSEEELDELGLA